MARVGAAVGIAVFAEDDVVVPLHDLAAPMIAIDADQRSWRGGQAVDQIDGLLLRRAPFPIHFLPAPTLYVADLAAYRPRPCGVRCADAPSGAAISAGQRGEPPL